MELGIAVRPVERPFAPRRGVAKSRDDLTRPLRPEILPPGRAALNNRHRPGINVKLETNLITHIRTPVSHPLCEPHPHPIDISLRDHGAIVLTPPLPAAAHGPIVAMRQHP